MLFRSTTNGDYELREHKKGICVNCFVKISWWQWHFWYSCWHCSYPIQLSKAILDIIYWRDSYNVKLSDMDRTIKIIQELREALMTEKTDQEYEEQ